MLRAVEQRIIPKNTELSRILNSISDKEKRFEEEESGKNSNSYSEDHNTSQYMLIILELIL